MEHGEIPRTGQTGKPSKGKDIIMRHLIQLAAMFILGTGSILFGAEEFPSRRKPLPAAEFHKHFESVAIAADQGALFGPRVYLGTAGTPEHYNTLTLGWGATGILWGKPVAIVYIRENRFSYRYFEKFPVFTLSWYPEKYRKTVYKVFGGKSGRDTDKEKLSAFTPVETPDGGVTYLEAEKVVVCRKLMHQKVPSGFVPEKWRERLNQDGLVHVQYTGEVLSVWRSRKSDLPPAQ